MDEVRSRPRRCGLSTCRFSSPWLLMHIIADHTTRVATVTTGRAQEDGRRARRDLREHQPARDALDPPRDAADHRAAVRGSRHDVSQKGSVSSQLSNGRVLAAVRAAHAPGRDRARHVRRLTGAPLDLDQLAALHLGARAAPPGALRRVSHGATMPQWASQCNQPVRPVVHDHTTARSASVASRPIAHGF